MSQLFADCLNEIFEYIDDDLTLHSCLLVNRLWCRVSVRILWKSIRNYNTLMTCLPNESREILYENGIITSSVPPIFNYVSFCKILSIDQVNYNLEKFLNNQPFISPQRFNDSLLIITREIFKLLINQISIRKLYFYSSLNTQKFTLFPGAKECLENLEELYCNSDIGPEFYHHLSQMCHNIQSLNITFEHDIQNGLTDLISVQKNLKCLEITQAYDCEDLKDVITSLESLPNTLVKLTLCGEERYMPLSFIANFTNLQEIILSFDDRAFFEDFKTLRHVNFSQLQVLKFQFECPRYELLIKFLENNGKNLKELYVNHSDNSLNLAIVRFCPNLRRLFTAFKNDELETLKMIFNSCQYLESIKTWCCNEHLNEKDLIEIVANNSPKSFRTLKLCYARNVRSELLPEELESFFICWTNRIPQKSLSLIIIRNDAYSLDTNDENMKIIRKYIELGIIRKFDYCYNDFII